MIKKINILSFSIFVFSGVAEAQQTADRLIIEGNEYYAARQFAMAEKSYANALQLERDNAIAKFNHAHALYQQGKLAEASREYEEIANYSRTKEWKNRAYYSQGVILTNQQKLEESIEAYKNALRNDPNDKEARENLQKALLELKRRKPNQQQQQDKSKQQKQQSPMSQREIDRNLKNLQERQKELQKRMQEAKSRNQSSGQKDW